MDVRYAEFRRSNRGIPRLSKPARLRLAMHLITGVAIALLPGEPYRVLRRLRWLTPRAQAGSGPPTQPRGPRRGRRPKSLSIRQFRHVTHFGDEPQSSHSTQHPACQQPLGGTV